MFDSSCEDKEESREREVQGPLLAVPIHARHHRQGEGGETQTKSAPR